LRVEELVLVGDFKKTRKNAYPPQGRQECLPHQERTLKRARQGKQECLSYQLVF